MTKESRRKLSEALKGNKHCLGRKVSQRTCEKHSKRMLRQANERLGPKELIAERRICLCGREFDVQVIKNRSGGYERTHCSRACANVREHSPETKQRISASLRHPREVELRERIKQGSRLIDLMNEFDVSYSKLKRLKREIRNKKRNQR